ncbi:MAG: VTT domain-containing protein [Acidobacteriota bacterium]
MNDVVALVAHHGYLIIFLVVLAEALNLPIPAALALIAGGASAAAGHLSAFTMICLAMAAMLIGDTLMFILGRYMGWALLGFLCKVSTNPETCILRSAESFYKRGKGTVVIAKFIPGVNAMTPPLAGSMKMRYEQFLWLDTAGALLYALAYTVVGYIFRDFVLTITRGFYAASHVLEIVLTLALAGYIGYRFWLYRKYRVYRVVPRVQVEELARKLQSEDSDKLLLVDVRSHGYYDSGASRIRGSVRIEPNNLNEEIKLLPKGKDIYVYCT